MRPLLNGRPGGSAATVPRAACCPATPVRVGSGQVATSTVALVGNPNVGKSTVFNTLTGARQHVGNWPGTTVQVASGRWVTDAGPVELVDLPGTYSLVGHSPAETLVRDLLVDRSAPGRPDLLVVVADAANPARNLYLLAQLLDLDLPVVVAVSMVDIAAARGLRVDTDLLARELGVPVVAVRPRTRTGTDPLAAVVASALRAPAARPPAPSLGEPIERAVSELAARLGAQPGQAARLPTHPGQAARFSARWLAIALLTGAERTDNGHAWSRPDVIRLRRRLAPVGSGFESDLETAVAAQRFEWVHRVVTACVHRPDRGRPTRSDRVDRVVTSGWLGLPLFFLVMSAMLAATTWLAAPLQDGLAGLLGGPVTGAARWLLAAAGQEHSWLAGLVVDGLLAGAGLVVTFVPLMAIMFGLLAVLEDSGYLARAAFAAHRWLRLLGLPGQAFLPLVVGFGCNVPAIAATRTLSQSRHRVLTSLLVPYVTCSARLVVYTMLASVFFGRAGGLVVAGMYLLSVLLVVLVGLGLRHTLFRRQRQEPLVLELPPYRVPAPRVVFRQTRQRLTGFLRKAGGPIVVMVAAVWLLTAVPLGGGGFGTGPVEDSLYGGVSRAVAPVFAPAGFGDWQAAGALVTGLVAKEAVVSTLGQTHGTAGPGGPDQVLRDTFDSASGGNAGAAALAFLVFVLAYPPCVATLAMQRAQIGLRWTAAGAVVQLAVAWSLATVAFQLGRLL